MCLTGKSSNFQDNPQLLRDHLYFHGNITETKIVNITILFKESSLYTLEEHSSTGAIDVGKSRNMAPRWEENIFLR